MPSRMTSKQWEEVSLKDKEVLKVLGILNLVKPKEKNKPSKSKALPALEPYILKRTGTCKVCKVTTTHYFKMVPFQTKRFLSSIAIREEDILPEEVIKEGKDFYSGCSHCFEVLSKMTKEELIRKIIKLSA